MQCAAFMSCAFPFHHPMKVANLTFISYNTYLLIYEIFIILTHINERTI